MDEDAYHQYISEIHAGHLKHLLVEKKIVDYTMVGHSSAPSRSSLIGCQQHNTSDAMNDIDKLFPNLPSVNRSDVDAFVTIVFRDVSDYIAVKNDPHFKKVVNPDHVNFSDGPNTVMSYGWFEKHVSDGRLVEG